MIDLFLLALIAGLVAVAYLFLSGKKKNLPPSPIGFPVIGHLYLLKKPVHRSLRDLSRNLGNMFFLRLGSRRAVVVTSASAFEEFLSQQNDIVFANRPMPTLNEYMTYNNTIVSTAPYGDHWRNLRRLCTVEIFSAARLRESSEIRRDEVRALLRTIQVATSRGNDYVRLKLRPLLSGLTFDILMSMVAGKREQDEDSKEFRELIREAFEFGGVTYVGDFLPILKLFDFNGYVKGVKKLCLKLDKFFRNWSTSIGETEVLLLAGTDTTAVTLEWAMANLLNHPDVIMKLKTELNDVSIEGRVLEDVGISLKKKKET